MIRLNEAIDVNIQHDLSEKRQFPRHPSNIPVEIIPYPEAALNHMEYEPLYLKNMSFGGLAFFSSECIPLDSIIHIRILSQAPFELVCRVVWTHALDSAEYEIGVEFVARKSTAMEQLVLVEMYRKLLESHC